jgi:hypothetical protein
MVLSIDVEKALDEIQHLFMIKALKKLGTERKFLNIIKAIYDKSRTNIILNGEELKALQSGMRQDCPFSPFLFNIVLESLVTAIR